MTFRDINDKNNIPTLTYLLAKIGYIYTRITRELYIS